MSCDKCCKQFVAITKLESRNLFLIFLNMGPMTDCPLKYCMVCPRLSQQCCLFTLVTSPLLHLRISHQKCQFLKIFKIGFAGSDRNVYMRGRVYIGRKDNERKGS